MDSKAPVLVTDSPLHVAPADGAVLAVGVISTEAVSIATSGGESSSLGKSLFVNIRRYPKIVGYCVAICSGVLLFGYDTSIVGTISALPAFRRDFGELFNGQYIIPSRWLSIFEVLGPMGNMVGSAFGGWLQDRMGRRMTFAFGSVLSAVAVGVMFSSNQLSTIDSRRGVFVMSKALQGIATGTLLTATQTYVSEIAPTCLRGSIMGLYPAFTLLGSLTGACVMLGVSGDDTSKGYGKAIASQWAFSAVPIVVAFLIPESPNYLIRKGKFDTALKHYKRLLSAKDDADAALRSMQHTLEVEREAASNVTYAECFQGSNRRRTLIVLFATSQVSLFGLPLLFSASYFLQLLGMDAKISLTINIVIISLGFAANATGMWILSCFGRRPVGLLSLGLASILWAAMGISGFWNGQPSLWYAAISMIVIVCVVGCGVWPAAAAIGGETSALRLRAKTISLGGLSANSVVIIFNFVLPYIYGPDAGNLKAKTGLFYAGVCAITTLAYWLIVPEMKDRTAEEVHYLFEARVSARRFAGWDAKGEIRSGEVSGQVDVVEVVHRGDKEDGTVSVARAPLT